MRHAHEENRSHTANVVYYIAILLVQLFFIITPYMDYMLETGGGQGWHDWDWYLCLGTEGTILVFTLTGHRVLLRLSERICIAAIVLSAGLMGIGAYGLFIMSEDIAAHLVNGAVLALLGVLFLGGIRLRRAIGKTESMKAEEGKRCPT